MARGDFPSNKQDQFMVRLPDGLRDRLKNEAEKSGRSMNAEIVHRLANSSDFGASLMSERVNHPPHYTAHPSGIECIAVVEHMNFCLGNAIKYIWRADLKGDAIEDLQKARYYIDREIHRRTRLAGEATR